MIQLVAGVHLALVPASFAGGEVALFLASAGLFGMGLADLTAGISERLSGGDDGADAEDDDELGGGDDTLDGMDDWDDGDDDLDEWGDDDLGELGGDGDGQSDLEPRLDDLENEVENISSTMGTVRSENEAINETVEEIEDNIRKLLEIYEMVTRGVNPFVDEQHGGGGLSGSFGLFEASDEDEYDDIDPDVAEADPESFFDEDFEEGELDDEGFDDDEFVSGSVQRGGGPDGNDGGSTSPPGDQSREDDADGKTFEDLKSEYESESEDSSEDGGDEEPGAESDAEPETWADIEPDDEEESRVDADGDTAGDAESAGDDGTDVDDPGQSGDGAHQDEPANADDQTGTGVGPDRGTTSDPSSASERDRDDEAGVVGGSEPAEDGTVSEAGATQTSADGTGDPSKSPEPSEDSTDEKPYLQSLPSGFGAELLVVEWLTYLRERSTTSEALRAIEYYQTIGWIGAPAAESLQRYLAGLGEGEPATPSAGRTQLTIDHHTNSLQYIGELGGRHVDVERLEWAGADGDGGIERREQRGIQR